VDESVLLELEGSHLLSAAEISGLLKERQRRCGMPPIKWITAVAPSPAEITESMRKNFKRNKP
jgi:hypothetical protein